MCSYLKQLIEAIGCILIFIVFILILRGIVPFDMKFINYLVITVLCSRLLFIKVIKEDFNSHPAFIKSWLRLFIILITYKVTEKTPNQSWNSVFWPIWLLMPPFIIYSIGSIFFLIMYGYRFFHSLCAFDFELINMYKQLRNGKYYAPSVPDIKKRIKRNFFTAVWFSLAYLGVITPFWVSISKLSTFLELNDSNGPDYEIIEAWFHLKTIIIWFVMNAFLLLVATYTFKQKLKEWANYHFKV